MRTRTLTVEGITYYCEFRRCGKAGCKCAGGDDLHGPYWYARDGDGRITYIGRALPDVIEVTHNRLTQAGRDIEDARRRLLEQAEALRRLSVRDSLSKKQQGMVRAAGFGACLVSPGDVAIAQDDDAAGAVFNWRL